LPRLETSDEQARWATRACQRLIWGRGPRRLRLDEDAATGAFSIVQRAIPI